MRKAKRNIFLIFLAIFFMSAFALIGTPGFNTKKSDALAAVFEMCDGVDLKLSSEGIRFKVKMDAETANDIKTETDVNLKFLIAPKSYFDEVSENGSGIKDYYNGLRKKVEITVNKDLIYREGEYYYANGCVIGIYPFNRELVYKSVAVIETAVGNVKTYKYATESDNCRSLVTVLNKAVLDDSEYATEVFSSYSWFGKAEYPVRIDSAEDLTALENVMSDSKAKESFIGKYFLIAENVQKSSAYASATSVNGVLNGIVNGTNVLTTYEITFTDYDGTVLQKSNEKEGKVPEYIGVTPTRNATAQYKYEFKGWDNEITAVTGAATYKATYKTETMTYKVSFDYGDGSSVVQKSVSYGENLYTADDGSNTNKKGHTFEGWYVGNERVSSSYTVTGDLSVTARYTVNQYVLTFSGCEERTVTYGERIGALPTAGWISNVSEWKAGGKTLSADTVYDYAENVTANAVTVYLTSDNVTEYTVVYPASATTAETEAATAFVKHVRKMTGVRIPMKSESQINYDSETSKIISIGNTSVASGISVSGLTHDGYTIKTFGKSIALKGENDNGTKYAVYGYLEQLGVRFVSTDYTYYPVERNIAVGKYNTQTSPDIAYRSYAGGGNTAEHSAELKQESNILWCDAYSVGYQDIHNTLCYVPVSEYYSTTAQKNANYHMFKRSSEYNKPSTAQDICWTDGINSNGEYDGTNPSAFSVALESLKKYVRNSSPECKYFMFGEMDVDVGSTCNCSTCKSIKNSYNVSGMYLRFVNCLAREIKKWAAAECPEREINLVMFAYVISAGAPKNVVAEDNVYIWLTEATSKPFTYITDSSQPTKYHDFITGWGKACNKFFLWTYPTYFSNTFMYVPTIYHLSHDLTLYKNIGLEYVFMQGAHTSSGDWQAIMKSYVANKIMWDTTLDPVTVRDEFLDAYCGAGSAKVKECINKMDKFFYENSNLTYYSDNTGWTPNLGAWTASECREEIALLDSAIAAIDASGVSAELKAIYKKHVRHIKMSPLGMLLYNNSAYTWELKEFYDLYEENGVQNFLIDIADNDILYNGVSTRDVYVGLNDTFDITKVTSRDAIASNEVAYWLLDGNAVNMNDSSLTLSPGKHSLELLYEYKKYGRYSMTITVAGTGNDVTDYIFVDENAKKITVEAALIKAARDKGNNYLMITANSKHSAWISVASGIGRGAWYSGDGKATVILDLSGVNVSDESAQITLFTLNEYTAEIYSAEFVNYSVHSSVNYAHNAYNYTGSGQIFAATNGETCKWTSAYDNRAVLDVLGYDCATETDENAWKAFYKTAARETACINSDLVKAAKDNGYNFIEIKYIALAGATELYYYGKPSAEEILSGFHPTLPSEYKKTAFKNGRATITLNLNDVDLTAKWLYLASSNGATLIESVRFVTASEIAGNAVTPIHNGGNFNNNG